MSERSVAEIIGWEFRKTGAVTRQDGITVIEHGYWCPPDVSYSDGSPPNVDDLFAWLRERAAPDDNPDRLKISVTDDGFVRVFVWPPFPAPAYHDADTILAALESAVRGIDEATR